jgi:N-acyl homoserine lactone hydrolase
MVTLGDVRRIDFGYFVEPAGPDGGSAPLVKPVVGYLVRRPDGYFLFDTGIGGGGGSYPELDEHYRLQRWSLPHALATAGISVDDVRWATNCHLHFDHCGGNPLLVGRPVYVQAGELATARGHGDYTLPELVAEDIGYEPVDGQAELLPGLFIVPTPGHVEGHQSLVVRCDDGTLICAGQSHVSSTAFTGDMLAMRARSDGLADPLPGYPGWLETLAAFDPARVVFAHDLAVWEPATGQWTEPRR